MYIKKHKWKSKNNSNEIGRNKPNLPGPPQNAHEKSYNISLTLHTFNDLNHQNKQQNPNNTIFWPGYGATGTDTLLVGCKTVQPFWKNSVLVSYKVKHNL